MNLRSIFLFAAFAPAAICSEVKTTRPNVLFIMVDDLRPEPGCYGSACARTPHMDRLAGRGIVFERAYCQQAHCASSRFSMLSGCRPDTAGIWTNEDVRPKLADKTFLPAHFKNHGYHTIGLGKIAHNNWEDPSCWSEPHRMPPNYPFEYRTRAGKALVAQMQREAAAAGLPDPFAGIPENIRRGMPYESLDVDDSDLGDGQLADDAIAALERVRDRPFFLGVGFLRPHLPFVAPKKYWDLHDPAGLPKVDAHAQHGGLPGLSSNGSRELRTQYRGVPAEGPLPDELARNLWHGYLACASYVDAQVGRLLAALSPNLIPYHEHLPHPKQKRPSARAGPRLGTDEARSRARHAGVRRAGIARANGRAAREKAFRPRRAGAPGPDRFCHGTAGSDEKGYGALSGLPQPGFRSAERQAPDNTADDLQVAHRPGAASASTGSRRGTSEKVSASSSRQPQTGILHPANE